MNVPNHYGSRELLAPGPKCSQTVAVANDELTSEDSRMTATSEFSPEVVDQFRRFVALADELRIPRVDSFTLQAFGNFLKHAQPLVVGPARELLAEVGENMDCLRPNLLPEDTDILCVAGLSYAEDAYTELMRWAMDPDVHPGVALACQRNWLSSFGVPGTISQAKKPESQLGTANGIPDLVIKYDEFLVIVEAKTGSSEHGARGGAVMQTMAYPSAVRAAKRLAPAFETYMIYLTPDRSSAANPNAKLVTYLGFALQLAKAVVGEAHDLPAHLHWAYSLVITHLATRAVPGNCDVRAALQLVDSLRSGQAADYEVLQGFPSFSAIHDLVRDY